MPQNVIRKAFVVVAFCMTGCAVTNEGVVIGQAPQFGASALVKSHQLHEEGEDISTRSPMPTDLILVGAVSSFRRFDVSSAETFYTSYVDFAKRLHPETESSISLEQFKASFAGWTKLKYVSVPLVMACYEDALVPFDISDQINFPTRAGVFLVQESGDLLTARTNVDGFYIVDRILCKNGNGHSDCAQQYKKGIFDANSGIQLDDKLRPKASGKTIDVHTYTVIH